MAENYDELLRRADYARTNPLAVKSSGKDRLIEEMDAAIRALQAENDWLSRPRKLEVVLSPDVVKLQADLARVTAERDRLREHVMRLADARDRAEATGARARSVGQDEQAASDADVVRELLRRSNEEKGQLRAQLATLAQERDAHAASADGALKQSDEMAKLVAALTARAEALEMLEKWLRESNERTAELVWYAPAVVAGQEMGELFVVGIASYGEGEPYGSGSSTDLASAIRAALEKASK